MELLVLAACIAREPIYITDLLGKSSGDGVFFFVFVLRVACNIRNFNSGSRRSHKSRNETQFVRVPPRICQGPYPSLKRECMPPDSYTYHPTFQYIFARTFALSPLRLLLFIYMRVYMLIYTWYVHMCVITRIRDIENSLIPFTIPFGQARNKYS